MRILIALETLILDDPAAPRSGADAQLAIDRLAWIGEPVVVAGDRVAGRRLPALPEERIGWIREALGRPDLAVAVLDGTWSEKGGGAAERAAVDGWRTLRDDWGADILVTDREASVGPARRAGLAVVRIGPRPTAAGASVERPDLEARDLLDAVSRLIATDTFGRSA